MTNKIVSVAIKYSTPGQCLAIRDMLESLGYTIHADFSFSDLKDSFFNRRPEGHIKISSRSCWRGEVTPAYKEISLEEFLSRHFSYNKVDKAQQELDKLMVQMKELQEQADKLQRVIKGGE